MADLYISLDEKEIAKIKVEGNKNAIEEMSDEGKDNIVFGKQLLDLDDISFNDGALNMCGSLTVNGTDIGYIGITEQLSLDLALSIINYYMKKLGKLKTVIEAVK